MYYILEFIKDNKKERRIITADDNVAADRLGRRYAERQNGLFQWVLEYPA